MKSVFLTLAVLLLGVAGGRAQFDKYFHNKTLRMDYFHCGDSQQEEYYFNELLEEPYWGGSLVNLVDTMFYGNYYVNVYDVKSGKLIYSRGYNTLFGEWRTVPEARTMRRCCEETVVMPFPKENVRVELMSRDKKGVFNKAFEYVVDVKSYFIKHDRRLASPVADILVAADPSKAVDIVLLPDGYTKDEMAKSRMLLLS